MFSMGMPTFNTPQMPIGGGSMGNSMFAMGAMAGMEAGMEGGMVNEAIMSSQLQNSQLQMEECMMMLMTLLQGLMSGGSGGAMNSSDPSIPGMSPVDGSSGGGSAPSDSSSPGPASTSSSATSAISSPTSSSVQNAVSQFAQAQEGKPYVYNTAGPSSFDCSGLTLKAWQQAGTTLPHNANAQYQAVPKVPIADAQVGDLVFFPGSDGTSSNPGHVGIVIDPAKHLMVSASTDGVALNKQIPVQNYMDEAGVYATVGRPVAGKNYT